MSVRACPILFKDWLFGQRSVMDTLQFTAFSSDLGWMAIAWNGPFLIELAFGHGTAKQATAALRAAAAASAATYSGARQPGSRRSRAATQRPTADRQVQSWITRLQAYAAGDSHDDLLDFDVDDSGLTAFQRSVIHHCRRIPRGVVVTYGELARQAGYPGAARAVGQVMATNRVPLVIPCHRVVAAGNRLGGYSAPQGLAMKKRLLALEGVSDFAKRGERRTEAPQRSAQSCQFRCPGCTA